MARTIEVEYTGDASDLVKASDKAERAVDDVGKSADHLGDKLDNAGSKSAQMAGGLGDLGGALSQMGGPLGGLGAGMEMLAPLIMGVTGLMDLATLAQGAMAVASRILTIAMMALPFILIGVLVAGLIAGIVLLYQHSETFRQIVQNAWEVVKQAIAVAWDVIQTIFGLWFLQFRLAWEAVQKLADIAGAAWGLIKSGVSEAVGWVIDKLGSIVSTITDLPGKLASAASGLWDFLWQGFKSAINKVIGWWNDFEISIGPISIPFAPDIPRISIGTPNIPLLAAGGIVSRATLAVIGEGGPEAVIPLSKAGGFGNVYMTVNVPATANPAETGRAVASVLRSYFAAGGRLRVPS